MAGEVATLDTRLAALGLRRLGERALAPGEGAEPGEARLLLLGPDEARFWPVFAQSPEYRDGAPDPLDRWSRRTLGDLARTVGGRAVFPFDVPPFLPFQRWAVETGRIFVSPVHLLVDATSGLWVSIRGALVLPGAARPASGRSPCATCADQPCRSACPVAALTPEGYDVPACKAHVARPEGTPCRTSGCRVRAACPVGRDLRRPAQAEFHMEAFL